MVYQGHQCLLALLSKKPWFQLLHQLVLMFKKVHLYSWMDSFLLYLRLVVCHFKMTVYLIYLKGFKAQLLGFCSTGRPGTMWKQHSRSISEKFQSQVCNPAPLLSNGISIANSRTEQSSHGWTRRWGFWGILTYPVALLECFLKRLLFQGLLRWM